MLSSPRRTRTSCLVLALLIVLAACGGTPAPESTPTLSADPRYPSLGNGGYDSTHYLLDLTVDVTHNTVDGTVTLTARATRHLKQFSLDLIGFEVRAVTVNSRPARVTRQGNKLTIIPSHALNSGGDFTTVISYHGTPTTMTTPSSDGGWHNLGQQVFVTSEPDGAEGWFPVNDVPRDKASYTFRLTVADPNLAVANGVLTQTIPHQGATTYIWEEHAPMASYLATLAVGRFSQVRQAGPHGLPIVIYAPAGLDAQASSVFASQPAMIAYFESLLGPFPFANYGAIITDADVRWALETQTRPVFSRSILTLQADTAQEGIAHELAHQWFGDSVSLLDWQDIWLNEGFATYLSWLWLEHTGDRAFLDGLMRSQYGYILNAPSYAALLNQPQMPSQHVLAILRRLFQPDGHPVSDDAILQAMGLSSSSRLTSARALGLLGVHPGSADAQGYLELAASSAPASPPKNDLFATSVYARGAMTLQALRIQLGDAAFFRILRDYAQRYRFGNASTADFIKVAAADSGRDLTGFFQTWLYNPSPPPMSALLPSQES